MDLNRFKSEMCVVLLRNLEMIVSEFGSKICESL